IGKTTVIHSTNNGTFLDRKGKTVSLDQFNHFWIYQPDLLQKDSPFCTPQTVQNIRQYLEEGHNVFLSGGTAELLKLLGLDDIQTKTTDFGNDRCQLGLIPETNETKIRSLFNGLREDNGVFWFSNAAFFIYDHFVAPKGKLLAKNSGGGVAPLIEYQLNNGDKKGIVLVLPWRVGRLYDESPKGYRNNFEKLLSNLLNYLNGTEISSVETLSTFDKEIVALKLAIQNLSETFDEQYPNGQKYLDQLDTIARQKDIVALNQLRREALLANPLLDFDRLLLIRRGEKQLGLPLNYTANSNIPKTGYENQLAVLSNWKAKSGLTSLLEPSNGRFIGDVDLHFDANRILFSMVNEQNLWRVFEMKIDGTGLHEVPLIPDTDVDNYDACYLPDDRIVFCSTACFSGVPCVNGTAAVCNLYRLEHNGDIRQLTYEQDQDWCPTLLNNGRLLYLRWEYTDLPHAFSRILFHANPDGTDQREYYGSGSYYPNSMFFAKAIPNHPTKFVAIVGGHHELPRIGDLVLFDPALGRRETEGAIQQIPGRNKTVEPVLLDFANVQTFPKFLHPYPLNENYFLVSAKPSPQKPWGIYLVDVFDNMVLIHEEPGYAMFEPIPVRKTPRPPIIPDRINPERQDADVFITDIYQGQGLKGVLPGTIKSLRIIGYQFSYREMGAEPYSVGLDGPWDPRQIIGTVPVQNDGSVSFKVPAYLPFAIQPLDEDGKAVQLMRSWITAMPGETVSCVGCHESQNTVTPSKKTKAAEMSPLEITPWYGQRRGFSFVREVQPVLDKYCISCHHAENKENIASFQDSPPKPLLENTNLINLKSRFSSSYYELRRFVRTPTKESDMNVLLPWEFHADTTRLVQLLQAGHYDVELDREAWDRLITWIDLNAPFHGNWRDIIMDDNSEQVKKQFDRRHEMRRRYAKTDSLLDDNPYQEYTPAVLTNSKPTAIPAVILSTNTLKVAAPVQVSTQQKTNSVAQQKPIKLTLGDNIDIELVPIPPLNENGNDNNKTFYMGMTEITNEQFAQFDSVHSSHIEYGDFIQFSPGERGWLLSRPQQPVVRVSWNRAMAFCAWLSKKCNKSITLPTEQQWEHACLAGTTTSFWYGTIETDFSPFANLSDISHQTIDPFGWSDRRTALPAWRPADIRFNDSSRVSASVGSYQPNCWGLYDMHGNVSEWTRSGQNRKIVCGGSWYDVPKRSQANFRQYYRPEQQVFDVGFRV
ncbi:MAG: SUMF1/EgtB/PvdO family nonheme iron enzyme, partial [Planctomycetaceae bacterium]|nr:SUMF1/EgtB/PvdO family nonheme iron enzyme [Planctomycetaceae bacterium]